MRKARIAVLGSATLAAALLSQGAASTQAATGPTWKVVAGGLENPRGLIFGPDDKLYVAEGGLGGTKTTVGKCTQVVAPIGPYSGDFTARISKVNVKTGARTTVVDGLPSDQTSAATGGLVSGVADVAFVGDDLFAMTSGAGCSHGFAKFDNSILSVDTEDHTVSRFADLSKFIKAHPVVNPNPGDFEPDGTWYGMRSHGDELFVVDPNHGEIDKVNEDGQISRVVDVSASQGHIVPTGIERLNGELYFVNLQVFDPGAAGNAGLYKVSKTGVVTNIAKGLTAAVDVLYHDGHWYALEAFTGFFAPAPFVAHTGTVVRLNSSGGWDTIVTGLSFPTAMTFGPDGHLYISNNGFGQPTNTGGEIVRVSSFDH